MPSRNKVASSKDGDEEAAEDKEDEENEKNNKDTNAKASLYSSIGRVDGVDNKSRSDDLTGPSDNSLRDEPSTQQAAGRSGGPDLPPSLTGSLAFTTDANRSLGSKDVPESPSKDSDIIVISDDVVVLESPKQTKSEPVLDIFVPEASMLAEALPLLSSPPDSLSAYELPPDSLSAYPPDSLSAYELDSLKSDPAIDDNNSDIEVLKTDIKTHIEKEAEEEKQDAQMQPEISAALSEKVNKVTVEKEQKVNRTKEEEEKGDESCQGAGQCGECECEMKPVDIESLGTRPAVEISLTVQAKVNTDRGKEINKDKVKKESETLGEKHHADKDIKDNTINASSNRISEDLVITNEGIKDASEDIDTIKVAVTDDSVGNAISGHSIDPNEHVIAMLKPDMDIHDKPMEKGPDVSDILGKEVKDMIDGMKSKPETAKDIAMDQGQFALEKVDDSAKSKVDALSQGAKGPSGVDKNTSDQPATSSKRRNRKRKGSRSKMQEKPAEPQEENSKPIKDLKKSQSIRDQEIHVKHPTNANEFLSFGMKLRIEGTENHTITDVEEGGPASEIGLM